MAAGQVPGARGRVGLEVVIDATRRENLYASLVRLQGCDKVQDVIEAAKRGVRVSWSWGAGSTGASRLPSAGLTWRGS